MQRLVFRLAAIILFAMSGVAQAGTIHFDVTGIVVFADSGNDFGLDFLDPVSMSGDYDDSFYDGIGFGTVPFGAGTGNTLTFHLGLVTLDETQDKDYFGGKLPEISFFNGFYVDSDVVMDLGVNGSPVNFASGGPGFLGADSNDLGIGGYWLASVPEPGALTLAALGLVSFGGMAWRKRRLPA